MSLSTFDLIERANLQQLAHPVRSARPRRCLKCRRFIRPGLRHISALVRSRRGRVSDRRIHYRCPEPSDPFGLPTALDEGLDRLNAALGAFAALAAASAIWVFVFLLASR